MKMLAFKSIFRLAYHSQAYFHTLYFIQNECLFWMFTNKIRALIQIPERRTVYTKHNRL